jgi:hypothetical protein
MASTLLFCGVMLSTNEGERYIQGTAKVALPSRAASSVQVWGASMDMGTMRFTATHLPCKIVPRVSKKQPPQTDQIHGEMLCAFSAST